MFETPGEIHIEITGNDLHKLENESGGHRIQRVPPTERKGRVHTSTVTVAIIDPAIKIKEYTDDDFIVEWYSGTGAGGQHRNKHQNSCRIIHKATKQVATAQCRSRLNSLESARSALISQLTSADTIAHMSIQSASRKSQVGSGMRGDKIRTIRFQDNSVKDHRTENTMSAELYMKGGMDKLW